MARTFVVVAIIVSAFCFSSVLARNAPNATAEKFTVVGKIYCDPCRFEFETRLSKPLEGVKVKLQCHKLENAGFKLTYQKEAITDASGVYSMTVDGDHEAEACEVIAGPNGNGKCTEVMTNKFDRIVLTKNMGVSSSVRLVNPLGYMTKEVDSQCSEVVKELGLDKLDD